MAQELLPVKDSTQPPFDWKFYLLMNPDIEAAGCPRTEKAAKEHWQSYGRHENRLAFHSDKEIFDIKYYFTRYKDVQTLTSLRDILFHWYRHGKPEGRMCCYPQRIQVTHQHSNDDKEDHIMRNHIMQNHPHNSKGMQTDIHTQEFEQTVQDRLTSLISGTSKPVVSGINNDENKVCIRVITRTSRRPNAFQMCRYSVLAQRIPANCTLCHHILFDNPLDSHYVRGHIVTPVQMTPRTSEHDFPANEYINTALSVSEWNGTKIDWNIVMDDDDMFIDPYAIYKIATYITAHEECMFLMWNTQMNANTILPSNTPWEHGNVPSCSFAFKGRPSHRWKGVKGGDFQFANTIIQQATDPGHIHHIQETFTALQWNPGWGERVDVPMCPIRTESIKALCTHGTSEPPTHACPHKPTDYDHKVLFQDFFECAYVLNLQRRKDRFDNTLRRFGQYGITNIHRFIGIDGKRDPTFGLYWTRYSSTNPKPPCIPSIGSLAILHSMRQLIEHSRQNRHTSCMVFQDDILLCTEFRRRCSVFLEAVTKAIPDWKLIYLGCTQHTWPKHMFETKINNEVGWYYPQGTADGAFAVAIRENIYEDLLQLIGTTNLPFDSGPLRSIQKKWPTQCVCAWPYLVVADVRDSDCRESRSQTEMAKKVRWNMNDFVLE